MCYGTADVILADNSQQIATKVFTSLSIYIKKKKLITSEFHTQIDGQVERNNNTFVSRLRLYISNNQLNWDTFVQPLTYV